MLTRLYPFLDPLHITPDLVRRLRDLADDSARLMGGRTVSPFVLRIAPTIDNWVIVLSPAGLRLTGDVTGHPELGSRRAMTSPVWFADPEGQWIRTLSRFYRLGSPLRPGDDDALARMLGHLATDDGTEDAA